MMFSKATATAAAQAGRFGGLAARRPLMTTTTTTAMRMAKPSSMSKTLTKTRTAFPTTVQQRAPLSDFAGLGGFKSSVNRVIGDKKNFAMGVAGGLALALLHSATGSENEFYEHRFKTHKSADDLASFYGGEELMELFCIFPFVGALMMRAGEFDEEGNVHTMGVPGEMIVSMVFSDEVSEETGNTAWFNKRERFRDNLFGYTCWDMVCNFGFRTLEDGTLECYHYGEYFHGNLPVVSQVMKLVFKIHSYWFAWSVQHHINHFAFTAETEEEEKWEEESRHNMPFFLVGHYGLFNVLGYFMGYRKYLGDQPPVFLTKRATESDDVDDDEDEDEEEDVLPIKLTATKLIISGDIAADKEATKLMLRGTKSDEDRKSVLARAYTMRKKEENAEGSAYAYATEAAKARHQTRRATRHMTRRSTLPLPSRKTASSSKSEEVAMATSPSTE